MDLPPVPHELVEALWTGVYVFGGVIASITVAFSTLVWWVLRTTRADRRECRQENAQLREQMRAAQQQQHAQTLSFVRAIEDVSHVLRSLRREVRGQELARPEAARSATPRPEALSADPFAPHDAAVAVTSPADETTQLIRQPAGHP